MDDDLRNAVLGKADKRTVVTAKEKKWPGGIVPYVFDKKIGTCAFVSLYRYNIPSCQGTVYI